MIKVRDEVGTLSATAKADLEGTPTPLMATVVFQDVPKPTMEAQMKACGVAEPTNICIGVNPVKRFSSVFYGSEVAPTSAQTSIMKAGNPRFREGDWAQGVKDIILRAQSHTQQKAVALTEAPKPVIVQQPLQVIEKPVPVWPFFLGFGILAMIVGVAVYFHRRNVKRLVRAAEDAERERAELAQRNIREQERWDRIEKTTAPAPKQTLVTESSPVAKFVAPEPERAPPVLPRPVVREEKRYVDRSRRPARREPTPAPVVVQSNNDLATGILIGQATAPRYEPPRYEPPRREPTPAPRRKDDTPAPSFSSSSSSSFFDSGGGGGSSGFGDSGGGGGSSDF